MKQFMKLVIVAVLLSPLFAYAGDGVKVEVLSRGNGVDLGAKRILQAVLGQAVGADQLSEYQHASIGFEGEVVFCFRYVDEAAAENLEPALKKAVESGEAVNMSEWDSSKACAAR